jgi:TonB family protein
VKERPHRAPNWAMVFNSLPDEATILATYHQLAKKYHPDNGGSTDIMQAINAARDAALIDLKNPAHPSPGIEDEEDGKKEEGKEHEQEAEDQGEEYQGEEYQGEEYQGEEQINPAPVFARPEKLAVTLAAVLLTSFVAFLIYTVGLPPLTNQPRLQSTNLPQAQPLPGSSGCVIWNIEHTHCRRYQWLVSSTTTQESNPIISSPQVSEKATIKLQEGQERSATLTPLQFDGSFDHVVVGSVVAAPEIPRMPDTSETQSASRKNAPTAQIPSTNALSQDMDDWHNKIGFMLQSKGRSIRMTLPRHGTVVVSFNVDRNGHMLESHIQQSSGFPLLDREVLSLVARAQPFPPIPPDYEKSSKVVTATVSF